MYLPQYGIDFHNGMKIDNGVTKVAAGTIIVQRVINVNWYANDSFAEEKVYNYYCENFFTGIQGVFRITKLK